MARPRTNHDGKKQDLIKISFELFMKNGYENTSIQDIMAAANISKGAMYHYFTCKEDILDAVLNFIIDMDEKRFEPILCNPSLSAMEKLTATMSPNISQPPEELREATEYVMQRPASIVDYRARELSKSRTIMSLSGLIREGIASGEFHTEHPEEMASFIFSSSQSMVELIMTQAGTSAMQKACGAFIQLLTYCLGLEKKEHDFLIDFFKKQFNYDAN